MTTTENSVEKLQRFFSNTWEGAREVKVYVKTDILTGEIITHFRMNHEDEWIPVPAWERGTIRPRITLMDAERWNAGNNGAKYVLMLARLSFPGLKALMQSRRIEKWRAEVLIVNYHLDFSTRSGHFTFQTMVDDYRLFVRLMGLFESSPLEVVDSTAGQQLELFGVPLVFAPSL